MKVDGRALAVLAHVGDHFCERTRGSDVLELLGRVENGLDDAGVMPWSAPGTVPATTAPRSV